MKISYNDNKIILYLNNLYINNLDFSNKEDIQKYLNRLFNDISNKYNIEFDGFYIVKLYVDTNYGVIIEIKKEELEYLDYFNNQIEMNTEVVRDSFLYEVDNIEKSNKFIIYKYNSDLYLRIKEKISDILMGRILEHSKIIYGKKALEIIRKGQVVR